jgi:electron transport complex protein RnfB
MEPIAESPDNWKWRYPVFEIKPVNNESKGLGLQ